MNLIGDLNSEEIAGTFHEKSCKNKPNKVQDRKSNKEKG